MRTPSRLCAIVACVLAPAAVAQVHSGDITLSLNAGTITTNATSGPDRVFTATLGESFENFTSDPGFDCLSGTFPTPSRVGFTISGALKRWTGSSFTFPIDERMEIAFGGAAGFSVLTPASDSSTPGFSLSVGSNGQWHRHLEYTLLSPASDGIYLLPLSLFSTNPSIAASETFYILFNQNATTTDLEAAVQWVRDNILSPFCPADWDQSGGVDGDDVIAFFAQWDQSNADFNTDGGTDGDDVIAFFAAWDSGC
jgi:hypothetical protein